MWPSPIGHIVPAFISALGHTSYTEAVHKTPEVFQPVQGHMHQTTLPRFNVHMQSTPTDLENIVTSPVARPQHQRYNTN